MLWEQPLLVLPQAQEAAAVGAQRCAERGKNLGGAERPGGQQSLVFPLLLLWFSTGMRHAEIRGLTWGCICWEEGEVLVMKSLGSDGYYSGHHSWATTKTGREQVVLLITQVRKTSKQYQQQMNWLDIYGRMGLYLSPLPATATSPTIWCVVSGSAACSVMDLSPAVSTPNATASCLTPSDGKPPR